MKRETEMKMVELSCMVFVNVATMDDQMPPLQLSIEVHNGRRHADEIHKKVCKEIGMSKCSRKYFALHEGKLNPKQAYKPDDLVAFPQNSLCLQKWCFDVKSEINILFEDPVALHLLYWQAKSDIQSGKLSPTFAESQLLEDYENEANEVEYVQLCQTLKDYTSAIVRRCSLLQEYSISFYDKGSIIDLMVRDSGLKLTHIGSNNKDGDSRSENEENSNDNRHTHFIPWYLIRSWSHNRVTSSMKYEVRVHGQGFHYLIVKTDQAKYLLSLTMEMIKILQGRADNAPSFHASMIRKDDDITHWDNIMYDPEKTDEPFIENNNT
ncbi:uncharacterized protein LOC141908314 [Tubulanus polymorphus]|uniref:uncharacterized protein LOC141908314 n=1 Tax=Tubulanus polymorphus TaxID=672921 RepID=UPI003DA57057